MNRSGRGWVGRGRPQHSNAGFAALMVLLLMTVLVTSVTTALMNSGLENRIVRNLQEGLQAHNFSVFYFQ